MPRNMPRSKKSSDFDEEIIFVDRSSFPSEVLLDLDPKNTLFISDGNTSVKCLPLLNLDKYHEIVIPSGELSKRFDICEAIFQKLLELNINRNGCIVNLGGGVVTDLGGFCASIYKRGISFINIPTSLLGMVDAALGGKTGINYLGLKNTIGTFSTAEKTIIFPEFLKTLPEKELRSGLAEVLKHGLIQDHSLWDNCVQYLKGSGAISEIIEPAVKVKQNIVESDPFENGIRKLLNFGHTIGHAIESVKFESESISHGDAVIAGMICETYISQRIGILDKESADEISAILTQYFDLIHLTEKELEIVRSNMLNDKKNTEKGVNFTLLSAIGSGKHDQYPPIELIEESLNYYASLQE
jgi:3-dehydroquinate synthase